MNAWRDNLGKQCACTTPWAKCDHSWHVEFRKTPVSLDVYCKRRGLPLVRLKGEAETLRDDIVMQIQAGTYQARPVVVAAAVTAGSLPSSEAAKPEGLTFDQAWPKYHALLPKASRRSEKSRCRGLADATIEKGRFGDLRLADITGGDVVECYTVVTEDAAESSKKKFRRHLRGVFTWAVENDKLPASPITAKTKLPAGEDARRSQRVSNALEADLVEAASEGRSDAAWRLVALIILALDTGLRIGELLALQWRDIKWAERLIEVRATEVGAKKSGRARTVPMGTPRVLEHLLRLAGMNPTGEPWPSIAYVCGDEVGGRVKSIRKAWVTCVLRANRLAAVWSGSALVEASRLAYQELNLHFHDLRHECAQRWYSVDRYSLGTIAELLGHADINTLRVYLGVTKQEALAEATRLSAHKWAAADAAQAAEGPQGGKTGVKAATGRVLPHHTKEVARRQMAG